MREKLTKRAYWGLLFLSLTAVTSCVDNDYDLSKDIDMNVTLGGNNLVLPASSTDNITMEDILDLEEGSALKAIEDAAEANELGVNIGDYVLQKGSEESTETRVEVAGVTVDMKNEELGFYRLNLEDLVKELEGVDELPDVTLPEPYELHRTEAVKDMNATINLHSEEVTEDVQSILEADVDLKLGLSLNFEAPRAVRRLALKTGFEITFPDYMKLKPCDNDIYQIKEGTSVLHFKKDFEVSRAGSSLITLEVDRIAFTKEMAENKQGLYKPGTFNLDLEIPFDGNYEYEVSVNNLAALKGANLTLNGSVRTQGGLTVTSMTGVVNPEVNINVDPVDITGIPDFLTNGDSNLDLANPRLELIVTNGTPVSVDLKAKLRAYDENGALLEEVSVGGPAGSESQVLVHGTPVGGTKQAQVIRFVRKKTQPGEIEVPDLHKLIAKIPSKMEIADIEANVVQEPVTVTLGQTYIVNTDYEVVAPLSFGEDLDFVYEDKMDDWNTDIEDIEISELEVELEAENKIPLELVLTYDENKGETPCVVALDKEGNPLNEIKVIVDENYGVLAAGSLDKPTTSTVKLRLTAEPGVMSRLDGLQYRLRAVSSPDYRDIAMNKAQTLTFKKVLLRVKNGIKIDLN